MAQTTFVFTVRDNAANPPGTRKVGLAPTWLFLSRLADGSAVAPPALVEIGQGQYKFSYDPSQSGEASGQIDAGASLANPGDRYVDVVLTNDTSGNVALGATGLDYIPITAPTGTAGTFREMVVQTWRHFFKKVTMTATQKKTYGDDGATVLTTQSLSDDGTTQGQGASS